VFAFAHGEPLAAEREMASLERILQRIRPHAECLHQPHDPRQLESLN
jgi:hypothetical protein